MFRRACLMSMVASVLLSTAQAVELKDLLTADAMPGWEEKPDEEGHPTKVSSWEIKDGVLHGTGKAGGSWWGTKADHTDFIIEFDFKVPPGGNSGVFLRAPKLGHPTFIGMEIQILDDFAPVYKDILPGQHCGSLYKIAPASKQVLKPAGEWNHMRITADGDHIVVEMNGETIVDANGTSHPEILNRIKVGPVGFQNHSTGVWYRNIRFADLAADRAERTRWFRDAKFGMFIHWGVYSVIGEGEWIMHVKKIPAAEYEKLPPQFNPTEFDADRWADLAKRAGVKYVVITSKHHDGFAMFDSKVSDYDIVDATPFQKDPMKPLADSCRQRNIRFGFYHSILDWHHPEYAPVPPWDKDARAAHAPDFDKYLEYMQTQVRELCSNYGPLACIWWDGGWEHNTPADKAKFARVNTMIRELQPQILINNRSHIPEDFDTPEQFIPPTGITNADGTPKLWESCITLTTGHGSHAPTAWWGYDKNEKEFKTPEFCIRMLIDIVSKGGNLLLNVGPDPTGTIGPNETMVLEAMGKWLAVNGEALYGTTASPFRYLPFYGRATVKGNTLYLHVFTWPGDHRLILPGLKNTIVNARVIKPAMSARKGSPSPLKVERTGTDTIIHLPDTAPDPIASVIAAELDGPPQVEAFTIRPDADGTLTLPALYAELRGQHGQRARLESAGEQVHIANWTNSKDQAAWQFEVPHDAAYEVSITYAADKAGAGGTCEIIAGDQKMEIKVEPTAGATDFATRKIGELNIKAGTATLIVRPVSIPNDGVLMNLREIVLRPKRP